MRKEWRYPPISFDDDKIYPFCQGVLFTLEAITEWDSGDRLDLIKSIWSFNNFITCYFDPKGPHILSNCVLTMLESSQLSQIFILHKFRKGEGVGGLKGTRTTKNNKYKYKNKI